MTAYTSAYQRVQRNIALALMEVGAVLTSASNHPLVVERKGPRGKERGFKLKLHEKNPDAPLSPFFLNLHTPDNPEPGPLTPWIVDLASRCMRNMQIEAEVRLDAVVGVPWAGDPFAEKLARLTGTTRLLMDKWKHGDKQCIASLKGPVPPEVRKVLVADDFVTQADSKRKAIENLRSEGMEVTDVVVLVDHERGGREHLARLGCTLHAVFTITELLGMYVDAGKIGPKLHADIRAYLAQTA